MKPLLFSDPFGDFIKLRRLPKRTGIELMGSWLDKGRQIFMHLEVWTDRAEWAECPVELIFVEGHEHTYEDDLVIKLNDTLYGITYQMHHERDCEVIAIPAAE